MAFPDREGRAEGGEMSGPGTGLRGPVLIVGDLT